MILEMKKSIEQTNKTTHSKIIRRKNENGKIQKNCEIVIILLQ